MYATFCNCTHTIIAVVLAQQELGETPLPAAVLVNLLPN